MPRRAWLTLLFPLGLAACGQKGPLHLPDEGGTVITRPAAPEAAPAPAPGETSSGPDAEGELPAPGTPPERGDETRRTRPPQ